ncbi:MAG: hypothetical protein ACOX3X_05175 [Eubacteriales bacterium]|jgi:hypothetical protein
MQKNTGIIAVLLILTILGGVFSYAWLGDNGMLANLGVTSHVHKSYFESGDGTSHIQYQTYDENGNPIIGKDENGNELDSSEGCAFEIKYPVQLYYFAWLQYFGYFNQPKPKEDSNEINQVYFYLSADLDMDGWVLPPIGTKEYPFVGNFDGNGHTIVNLTIKNQTGLTDDPVRDGNLSNTEIVGFFGVVGSLNIDYGNPDYGKVNGAIDNNGVMTAVAGYSYDTSINEIKNFNLTGTTQITTETNTSLMGIVAGYVNGKVDNVRVGETATITISDATSATQYTSNISDFTLMGYVTDAYTDTSDVAVVDIATPTFASSQFTYTAQGASAGWGGSIDMKDLYYRLINIRNNNNLKTITASNHIATEIRRYASDGTLIGTPQTINGVPSEDNYKLYTAADNGSGQYVFSYNYSSSNQFNYLASTYKNVITIRETGLYEDSFYIKYRNTYLNLNNNKNGITASSTKNTKWVIDDDTYIRTSDNDGNIYYLNNSGTTLTIGTVGTTSWTKDTDAIYCDAGYIQYDNNTWLLKSNKRTGYTIASGTNYLNLTSTNSVGTGNSVADYNHEGNTIWTFSNTNNINNPSGTISTTVGGTIYYLNNSTTNGGNLQVVTQYPTSWNNYNTWNNYYNRLIAEQDRSYRYIWYNNGWRSSNRNSTELTITPITITITLPSLFFEDTTSEIITREIKSKPAEFSYIPLGALQTSPYTVENGNTGYIIAGSYDATDRKSDIRVSRYAISNISGGLTNGQLANSKVKTIKNSSIHTITTNNIINSFERYNSASGQFNTTLNGASDVYGLHFMEATISIDHLIKAPVVKIEGETFTDYEMPEDCIDFIVHEKGFITFFAGTYFPDNNTFFSLHVIERDGNKKITAIKEIKKIFGTGTPSDDYIYQYTDNTFSDGQSRTLSDNSFGKDGKKYTMMFDTTWITEPDTKSSLWNNTSVFYFEIPVNAGEYALGSVKGKIGAYLMYLDIGANAQLVNRAAITEKFNETTYMYKYPTGATFTNDFFTELTSPIDPSFVGLMTNSNNSVSVSVSPDNNSLVVTGIDSKYNVYYVKDGITVTLIGSQSQPILTGGKPSKTTSVKIQRTTYYDYNIALNRYTITEVVAKRLYNNDTTFTINAWQATYNNGTWEKGTQIATNVTFSSPATLMEYHDAVGGIPAFYLYKVGPGENDETLRFDADIFNQVVWPDSPYRNKLWYAIKDNSTSIITYTYNDSTGQYTVDINAPGSGEVRVEGEGCTVNKSEN